MTNETRERSSDANNMPLVWYVYILELPTSGYYIGQTNDLETRTAEHTFGGGATATTQSSGKLVWFSHTHDREAAHRMEARLQAAYERAPTQIRDQVDRFQRLVRLVVPEKTLRELKEEQTEWDRAAAGRFHLLAPRKPGNVFVSAACGYQGSGRVWEQDARVGSVNASFETNDIASMEPAVLLQREKERKALEAVGGEDKRKPVCIPCYERAAATSH